MKLPGLNPGAHLQNVNEDTSIGATINIAQRFRFVKWFDKDKSRFLDIYNILWYNIDRRGMDSVKGVYYGEHKR